MTTQRERIIEILTQIENRHSILGQITLHRPLISDILNLFESEIGKAKREVADKIDDLIKVQKNCCTNEYMRGLYNGLVCAKSCLTGDEPMYCDDIITQFQDHIVNDNKMVKEKE